MTRILLSLSLVLATCLSLYAQGISYQAVVRGPEGTPLANQAVSFRFSYAPDSDTTLTTYAETFAVTTNEFGLATLALTTGEAEEGSTDDLNFNITQYWLRTELDVDGGTNYEMMGTEPLRAVPYALNTSSSTVTVLEGAYGVNCLEGTQDLRVCAWTIGGLATSLTGSGAGYTLTTNSPHDPLKIIVEGNSTSTNGVGEFVFTLQRSGDHPVSYYSMQMYDLSNDQVVDAQLTGNIFKQEIIDGNLKIVIPNISGNYPNGFRLILN